MTTSGRHTLEHAGRLLEVEAVPAGRGTIARLLIDGEPAAEAASTFGRVTLDAAGHRVVVQCWRPGRLATCVLRAAGDDADEGAARRAPDLPFEPPPGTRAAELSRLKRKRPGLYVASRL